jgi:hypothetical protein
MRDGGEAERERERANVFEIGGRGLRDTERPIFWKRKRQRNYILEQRRREKERGSD